MPVAVPHRLVVYGFSVTTQRKFFHL